MSALPNPLQELAEKLAMELRNSGGMYDFDLKEHRDEAIALFMPVLTASVGTLLQAERAAMCEIFIGHRYVTREEFGDPLCSCGYELPEDSTDDCGSYYAHIRTLADASAMEVVVAREVKEAVKEQKEIAKFYYDDATEQITNLKALLHNALYADPRENKKIVERVKEALK